MRYIGKFSLGAMMALGISGVAIGQTPAPASRAPAAASDSVAIQRSATRVASPARRGLQARRVAEARHVQRVQQVQRVQRAQRVQQARRRERALRASIVPRTQMHQMQPQRLQKQRVLRMQRPARVQRMHRQGVQRVQPQRVQRPRGMEGPQGAQRPGGMLRMARPGRPMSVQRSRLSPRGVGADVGRSSLLRGMTLSEEQTSQVRAIRERARNRTEELRQEFRSAITPGTAPDSARMAALRARSGEVSEQLAEARKQELADVRAVLTPEQQQAFDTNRERVAERGAARRERMGRTERSPGQLRRP